MITTGVGGGVVSVNGGAVYSQGAVAWSAGKGWGGEESGIVEWSGGSKGGGRGSIIVERRRDGGQLVLGVNQELRIAYDNYRCEQ